MTEKIPEFKHSPIDTIASKVKALHSTFSSHKSKSLDFRLLQLRKLYWGLRDNEAAMCDALNRDLSKSPFEAFVGEIEWCKNDIIFTCNNLDKWAKDERPADIPLLNSILAPTIRKEPLGCVLIIGAYNVPFQLTIVPLVGAIAAGNTAVVKPSESSPACAAVLQDIMAKHLDPTCYTCIQGGIPETTALLDQKWNKIFYTGSVTVAKVIAKKAAETLTPCTLELGGRNPAIVTKNANIRLAARRLLWAKFHNAGQICVSQNYILIDHSVLPDFLNELKSAVSEFCPTGAQSSPDYGRIVNQHHFERLQSLLSTASGKILIGGAMDASSKFIEPTIVQVSSIQSPLITNETFGPILTLLPVPDLPSAIRIANQVHPTPLAVFPFGTKDETDQILNEVTSGGASVNDGWIHCTVPTMEFGGIGDSGTGSYRGKASFDCFTHRRGIATSPGWAEGLLAFRYPPYKGKKEVYLGMTQLEPGFDREGRVKMGFVRWAIEVRAGAKRMVEMVRYTLSLLGK